MADSGGVKGVVLERIGILFSLAKKEAKAHPERGKRYVFLARKLATRFRLRLPAQFKKSFCKKCNSLYLPGINAKVRLDSRTRRVVYECACGEKRAMPYKNKVK